MKASSEEGPHTLHLCDVVGASKDASRERRAPEQKRHSSCGAMNYARS